jgi:hypothetical protein
MYVVYTANLFFSSFQTIVVEFNAGLWISCMRKVPSFAGILLMKFQCLRIFMKYVVLEAEDSEFAAKHVAT